MAVAGIGTMKGSNKNTLLVIEAPVFIKAAHKLLNLDLLLILLSLWLFSALFNPSVACAPLGYYKFRITRLGVGFRGLTFAALPRDFLRG